MRTIETLMQKPGVVMHIYKLSAWEAETDGSLELTGYHSSLIGELQVPVRHFVSKTKMGKRQFSS